MLRRLVYCLLSALCFGSYGVWSRLMGSDFGVFAQSWSRGLFLSILLIPILVYRKELVVIKREDGKWMLVFCFTTALTQAPLLKYKYASLH